MLFTPLSAFADGCFVAPKFIWDKHKDINEPTQKAIIVYDAGREDLILQVKYEGPTDEFGWLVPVPNLPEVKLGSMKCFYELSQFTQQLWPPVSQNRGDQLPIPSSLGQEREPPVKVIEIKTVGAYEIAILSTKDTGALGKWLDANGFYFPTGQTDVIDAYVKQQYYFVAARINTSRSSSFELLSPRQAGKKPAGNYSAHLKLASGELSPLQISFASDHCVFPLKISSVNGKPSEVQVYVLCPEPLLEKTLLEKELPLIHSNDMVRAAQRAKWYRENRFRRNRLRTLDPASPLPLLSSEEREINRISQRPELGPDELLHFAKVTQHALPECRRIIARLGDKSWWLMKQTWTFAPEEMRDLEFAPAIPYFAALLDSQSGYYAVASLETFTTDAVPALLDTVKNAKDPEVRGLAAGAFNYDLRDITDLRLTAAAPSWLKDSEPKVRAAAVYILGRSWDPKYAGTLVGLLNDRDPEVRGLAGAFLQQHPGDIENFVPRFRAMLTDQDPVAHGLGFELLHHLGEPLSREELLGVFKAPTMGAVWDAYEEFKKQTGRDLSDSEDMVVLQNSEPNIRGGLGLLVLYQNADPQAVDLAMPLLQDPEIPVRAAAARTLRALTGQHFTYEQEAEWEKWWAENKGTFVAQQHPEEMWPQRRWLRPGGDGGSEGQPMIPHQPMPGTGSATN